MSLIDDYLHKIDSVQKTELERIRIIALEMLPVAEEVISYGMPTIRYNGKSIKGLMLVRIILAIVDEVRTKLCN